MTLLELDQILGRPAVSPEEAERNKAEAQEAARRGVRLTAPRKPRPEIAPMIPMSRSAWWGHIREGRAPKPIKIGRRSFWRYEDVLALIEGGTR